MQLVIANNNQRKETVKSMQKRTGANYIINGGFFWSSSSVKWVNQTVNLLDDGKVFMDGGNFSRFAMNVYNKNHIHFGKYTKTRDLTTAIGGSPSLIVNGEIKIDHSIGHENNRHPRTAIGATENSLLLVVADGRQNKYKGVTLKELANFIIDKKCINAINLDGGGSTILMKGNNVLNAATEDRLIHNSIIINTK